MHSRLLKHLNKNNILSKHQFGFRANMATDSAIFSLISGILNALNQKTLASGIFCDLEKTFDCVSHKFYWKNESIMESMINNTIYISLVYRTDFRELKF
jgi:hypothetical protein